MREGRIALRIFIKVRGWKGEGDKKVGLEQEGDEKGVIDE